MTQKKISEKAVYLVVNSLYVCVILIFCGAFLLIDWIFWGLYNFSPASIEIFLKYFGTLTCVSTASSLCGINYARHAMKLPANFPNYQGKNVKLGTRQEYNKKYYQRPEFKAKMKEYYQRRKQEMEETFKKARGLA